MPLREKDCCGKKWLQWLVVDVCVGEEGCCVWWRDESSRRGREEQRLYVNEADRPCTAPACEAVPQGDLANGSEVVQSNGH